LKYKIDKSRLIEMEYERDRSKESTILYSDFYRDLKFVVASLQTHPCGYVGIPEGHRLHVNSLIKHSKFKHETEVFEHDYDVTHEIYYFVDVHGGFTFSSSGGKSDLLEEGYLWLGWDYAHAGDFMGYTLGDVPELKSFLGDKKHTTEEIIEEAISVIDQLHEIGSEEFNQRKIEMELELEITNSKYAGDDWKKDS
jgi:hypothetical protein